MRRFLLATGFVTISAVIAACSGGGGGGAPTPPNDDTPRPTDDEVIRIPVVVHVIYSDDTYNISPEKIYSQIAVLNEDFNKLNPDHTKTPEEFSDLVADVGIEFHLATTDPSGQPTDGITRTYSEIDGWSGRSVTDVPVEDLALYHTDQGGHDAWPSDRYLNIWVSEMSNRLGDVGLPGYAQFPGGDARIDGVVIDPRVFGTLAPLVESQSLGRTATHEIGHWLNLLHIYAGNDSCDSSDLVDDTPSARSQYGGTPSYPQTSCGSTDITMNFMDYVDDDAMYMFTHGQKMRMRDVFSNGGGREQLYKNIITSTRDN